MQAIEIFDRGASLNPDGTCFATPDGARRWTYRETQALTHRIAAALARDGYGAGAKVAVLSPNAPEAFMCVLGTLRAGAIWVGVNAKSSPPDIADLLDLVDADVLIYHPSLLAAAEHVAEHAPVKQLIALEAGGRDGDPLVDDWMAPEGARVALPPDDGDAVAMLVGTGGTTGRPKAVQVPHRAFESMTLAYVVHMREAEPVQLLAAPMTHAAGAMTFPVFLVGGAHIVHTGVVPAEILDSIERNRVTRLFLPPTAIYALLAQPDVRDHDYSSLQYFLYAAAPMSVDKLKQAIDVFGPVMTQSFGQSEAPMVCTFLGPEEHVEALADPAKEKRLASCGRPSIVATVAIMDDEGKLVAPGERGEIVVRGSLRMLGYYKDPDKTAEATREGWLATGDIGYIDDDGYCYIVDRKKDMIISGGFNVFPSEVEQVIWGHPAVNDCAVIGVPDDKWGEMVTAVVECKDGGEVEADELIALCKERLGSVKAPKVVEFRELPRSPVGKVLKRELRETYWTGRERAV